MLETDIKVVWIQRRVLLRIVITILLAIGAWLVRHLMVPSITLLQHVIATLALIVLIQLIWEVFERTHNLLNRLLPFSRFLFTRIIVQLLSGIIILVGLRVISIYFLRDHLPFELDNVTMVMMLIANIGLAVTINMVFIGGHFVQRWKKEIIKVESVEKEKAQMQYHHLKNQVNPHFLFNALTSLDTLIKTNPDLASQYIGHLAKVYRYVLEHREREVVPIGTELDFIHHYIELQKIRFGSGLNVQIEISESAKQKGIVMVTLQMLIDNAIKHNEIHPQRPLNIQIADTTEMLTIKNNRQKKELPKGFSTQQGLLQLIALYEYLSKIPVRVSDENEYFTVEIPLL